MTLTFLGTGTSQGVPMIAGEHEGLDISNPKNWRTRSSAHVELGGLHIQIDAGPEFRMQCIAQNITWIDLFILTHGHADHIAGMDDLRRFSERMKDEKLPVFADKFGRERIEAMFPYALNTAPTQRGYPCFELRPMPETMELSNGGKIHSVELPHGNINTLGLVFEHCGKKIAYYNDFKTVTPRAEKLAQGADILVIDGLRPGAHPSHMSITEAVSASQKLNAKETYITHTTWQIDYDTWSKKIPQNCHIAYDGLRLEI